MKTHTASKIFRFVLLSFFLALLFVRFGAAAEVDTASQASTNSQPENAVAPPETLRSYLQIQEQLHDTQLALERNRQEAAAANARTLELLQDRLNLTEKSLASQRIEELKDMQRSNRWTLLVTGVFAGLGFLVLLFIAFLQWNAVNRLATVVSALPAAHSLAPSLATAALGMGEARLMGGAVEESNIKLMGTIERLEKRLLEMESSMQAKRSLPPAVHTNGHKEMPADAHAPSSSQARALDMLLGKGETLLKLDQAEAALACFDEALAIDPGSAEALVRKGLALERLQRLEEAVAFYDRAIAADSSLTMAYLYKGGIFNRMERHSEALECYEQALKTQEKNPAAKPVLQS